VSDSEKILFLCTGNSCRSQMAEGIANKFTCFQAFSAGTRKSSLNPYAVKVMSEIKIDITNQFSKTIAELEEQDFKYVFTLCSDAEENCPVFLQGKTIHIAFDDPPKLAENIEDEIQILNIYRKVRDEILDCILNISNYI
jgi:arsenate reductase